MSAPGSESVGAALGSAQASEPAWVRNGSAEVQREYALGLEFERLLVQQLATSLTETTEPAGDEGESGSRGATSTLSSMLPGALADGVVNGGGLGLAAELARGMQAGVGASPTGAARATAPSGGVEAGSTGGAPA